MKTKDDNAAATEIGEESLELEVLKSKQPVLVEFWDPWSRPCHILHSALDGVTNACGDRVKVVKVNADNNPGLSLFYEIQSIPTLLYFVAGNVRARIVGTASKDAILSKIYSVALGGDSKTPDPHTHKENEHYHL